VTDILTLKYYASEAGCASFFRQETPNHLDPLDQAILTVTLSSVSKLLRTELVRSKMLQTEAQPLCFSKLRLCMICLWFDRFVFIVLVLFPMV
jgi:hypothetical protein